MTDLKPCPFCFGESEFKWQGYDPYMDGGRWFIVCKEGCDGSIANSEDKSEAIDMYNTRPRCDECARWQETISGCFPECMSLGITTEPDFYCAKFKRKIK